MNEIRKLINKIIYLYVKIKSTFFQFLWIICYFLLIFYLSALFSYLIMTLFFKIDFNISDINNFNVLKCLVFLITNTFLVFILSIIFNLIYFQFNKNKWVYTVVNAFLLVMTSSVIFIILGLNTTIETYVVNKFVKLINNGQYGNINMEEAVYLIKTLYNMFVYWISSTVVSFQIAFTLVNNYRIKS